MWRRLSTQLRPLSVSRSLRTPNRCIAGDISSSPPPCRPAASGFSRRFSTPSGAVSKKKVEEVMPIATGHEREELEAELEGRDILDINFPQGPFGTKKIKYTTQRRYVRRLPEMASKLLTRIRTAYRATNLLDPTRISPCRRSLILGASQSLLQSRLYSDDQDIKLTAPVSPVSSLNETELIKFSAIADSWWDADGPFKPLHVMNPTRLAFIRSALCRHFRKDPNTARPFEGLKFVDVGCGGGILSEPLARMGASVTGVDAVDKNIKVARLHADLDPITSSIEYRCTTAEKLVEEQREFDAVLALEVIEHVADPAEFCKSLSALTVSQGATVISTINRSVRAYAAAIIAAEYLLQWLPKGTHDWSSFLTPEELVLILQRSSISIEEMAGFMYNPLTGQWSLSDDIGVNFIAFGTKSN